MMQNICKKFLVVLMFGLIHVDALSMKEKNDSDDGNSSILLRKKGEKNIKKKNQKAHNINRNDEKYSLKSDFLQFIEEKESLENFEKEHDKTLKILDILTNVRDEIEKKEFEIGKADIDNNFNDINKNKNYSEKINKCENKDINTIKFFNSILNEEIKKNAELKNVKKEHIKKELKYAINKYNDFFQEKSEIENIENEIKKDIKKKEEEIEILKEKKKLKEEIDEGTKLKEEIEQCKEEEKRYKKLEENYISEASKKVSNTEGLLEKKKEKLSDLEWEKSKWDADPERIKDANAEVCQIEKELNNIQQCKKRKEEIQLDRKKRQESLAEKEKIFNDLNLREKIKKFKELEDNEKIEEIKKQEEEELKEMESLEEKKKKEEELIKEKDKLGEEYMSLIRSEKDLLPIETSEKNRINVSNTYINIVEIDNKLSSMSLTKEEQKRLAELKNQENQIKVGLGDLEKKINEIKEREKERETELTKLNTEKEKLDKELEKVEKRIKILSPSDEELQTAFDEINDIKGKQIDEEGRDVNKIDEGIKNKIKGMVKNSRQENENDGEVLLQELRTNIQALDEYIKHDTDTNDYKKGYKMKIREKEPEKKKDGYGVREYIKSGMDNLTRMIKKATNEQQINEERKEKILKEIEKIQNTAIDFDPTTSFEQKKEERNGEEKINEENKDHEIKEKMKEQRTKIMINEDLKEEPLYKKPKKEKEDKEKPESFEEGISASLEKIKKLYCESKKGSNKSVDVLDEKVMGKAQKLIESEGNILKGQNKDKILTKIEKIKDFVNDLSKKNEEKKKEKEINEKINTYKEKIEEIEQNDKKKSEIIKLQRKIKNYLNKKKPKEKEEPKDKNGKGEEKKHLIGLFSADEQGLITSRGSLEFNDEDGALQQIKENNNIDNIDNIKFDSNNEDSKLQKENNNIDNIDDIGNIDLNYSNSQEKEINNIKVENLVDRKSLGNGDIEENLLNNSTSTWHSDNDQSIAGYLNSEEYKDLKDLVINKEINTEKECNKIDKKRNEKGKHFKEDIIDTSSENNLEEKNEEENEKEIIKENSIIEKEKYINKESHQKQQYDAASLLKKGLHLNEIAKIKGYYNGRKQSLVYKEECLKKKFPTFFKQDISPKKNISPDNVIENNKVEKNEIAEYQNKLKLLKEEDSKFSSLIFFRVLGRFALSFLFSAVNSVMQFERKDVIGPYFSIYTLSFGKITQPSFLRKNIYIDISLSLLSFLIFTAFDQKIQNKYRAYVKDHSLCNFLSLIKYTTNAFNININLFVNKDFYISFNIMSIFDSLLNLVWFKTQIKDEIKCKIVEIKKKIFIKKECTAGESYKADVNEKKGKLKNILNKHNIAFYKWDFLRRMFIYAYTKKDDGIREYLEKFNIKL